MPVKRKVTASLKAGAADPEGSRQPSSAKKRRNVGEEVQEGQGPPLVQEKQDPFAGCLNAAIQTELANCDNTISSHEIFQGLLDDLPTNFCGAQPYDGKIAAENFKEGTTYLQHFVIETLKQFQEMVKRNSRT